MSAADTPFFESPRGVKKAERPSPGNGGPALLVIVLLLAVVVITLVGTTALDKVRQHGGCGTPTTHELTASSCP